MRTRAWTNLVGATGTYPDGSRPARRWPCSTAGPTRSGGRRSATTASTRRWCPCPNCSILWYQKRSSSCRSRNLPAGPYSDYWFLTSEGVAGRPIKGKQQPLQSADDFHSKILKDVKALELCFDAFEQQQNVNPKYEWSLDAVQSCVYDRMHFRT